MKYAIIICIFSLCFFFEASISFAAEVSVSVEEQKRRDSDKEKILRSELTQEINFIEEKKQLVAISDAMQDSQGAKALQAEIQQHQLNIDLLKKELQPKQGGGSTKTSTRQTGTAKAPSEQAETENPDWWNPYTRKPSISMY